MSSPVKYKTVCSIWLLYLISAAKYWTDKDVFTFIFSKQGRNGLHLWKNWIERFEKWFMDRMVWLTDWVRNASKFMTCFRKYKLWTEWVTDDQD